MTHTGSRGRTVHQRWWAVGFAVALLLGGGFVAWRVVDDGHEPGPEQQASLITPEIWLDRTADLLERAVWVDRQRAVVIMPASSPPADHLARAYDLAIGITGLGPHAPKVVAELGLTQLRQRLTRDLAGAAERDIFWEDLLSFYVARELLRAEQLIPGLLTDQSLALFTRLVDTVVGDLPSGWHAADIRSVVDVSRALSHRADDAIRWAGEMAGQLDLACESSEDLAYLNGAVIAGLQTPCDDQAVTRLWEQLRDSVRQRAASGDHDCFSVLVLTEAWHHRWPGDTDRRTELISLLDEFAPVVAGTDLVDLHYCLRDLQPAAGLLGQPLELSEAAAGYLKVFLHGAGVPQPVQLDLSGFPQVLRLARLTGGASATPGPPPADAPAVERLEYLIEAAGPGSAWTPRVARLVEAVATANPDQPALAVLMRALAYHDNPPCDSAAVALARQLAGTAEDGLRQAELATTARAVATLAGCGEPLPAAGAAVRTAAERALAPIRSGDPPALPVAADAVAALCAVSPDTIPDQPSRWRAYAASASPAGGAVAGDAPVSIPRTLALAEVLRATGEGCDRLGVIG